MKIENRKLQNSKWNGRLSAHLRIPPAASYILHFSIFVFRFSLQFLSSLLTVSLPATAVEVTLNNRHFTLPDGFIIELVAAPPLVSRPITADFDEAGHLYVADASGSGDKVEKQ